MLRALVEAEWGTTPPEAREASGASAASVASRARAAAQMQRNCLLQRCCCFTLLLLFALCGAVLASFLPTLRNATVFKRASRSMLKQVLLKRFKCEHGSKVWEIKGTQKWTFKNLFRVHVGASFLTVLEVRFGHFLDTFLTF